MKKCYANKLGGCSNKLSDEHFDSNGIQQLLGDGPYMEVTGYPWLGPGETRKIAKGAHKSPVLCTNHNNNLSSVDAEGIALFKYLISIEDWKRGKLNFDSIEKEIVVKGDLIERWLLKYTIGALVSGNTNAGKIQTNIEFATDELVEILFQKRSWPKGWGLYVDAGKKINMSKKSLGANFANDRRNDKLIVVMFNFGGLNFSLSICHVEKPIEEVSENDLSKNLRFRPTKISFIKDWKIFEVFFGWPKSYVLGPEVNLMAV